MTDLTPQSSQNQALTSTRSAVSLGWLAYEVADPRYPQTPTRAKILVIAPEAEARQSLKALAAKYRPATLEEIAARLARLSVQYWQPDQTEAMNDLKWGDYCAALSGISDELLGHACMSWFRSPKEFMPKAGQLLDLVKSEMADLYRRRRGLDEIIQALDRPEPPKESETVCDPERAKEILRKYRIADPDAAAADHKAEVLARAPIPYVETPPEVKIARMEALRRRLDAIDYHGKPES